MKSWTKEIKIALTAIVAAICVFVGINFLKGINVFGSSRTYYVKFRDCAGLQVTNAVYANGFPVGIVRNINYNYSDNDGVVAEIELDSEMQLPAGTVAELEKGIMGGVTLNLMLGPNPCALLSLHDTIQGGPRQGALDLAGAMVPDIQRLLPKLDSILVNINALTANPALAASLANLQKISADLAQVTSNLPKTMAQVDGTVSNLNSMSGKFNEMDFQSTLNSVDSTLAATHALIGRFDQLSADIDSKLNSRDGTLGLLLNDTQLHDNLNRTVQSADSLVTDLKAHPKRYVHFSIFGKKDK
ncbi:MAG: MCE family protein [Bacteroidales bacterium]|nr:MCE family protein [Candidatus Equimonas faecalis]